MRKTSTLVTELLKNHTNTPQKSSFDANLEPSDVLIDKILNYSKSLTIKKSNTLGFIELMAN